jgi:putative nucleotidyltransferase with HDIG domain
MNSLPVKWVENKNFANGMFTSVQSGISALGECDAFFILPVDIPLVRPHTIRHIMNAYTPETNVIIPTFMGKSGHPPLISFRHRNAILDYDGSGGLGGFFAKSASINKLPAGDEGILMDCDTPEDYQNLSSIAGRKAAPSSDECMEILCDVRRLDERIVDHSAAVTKLALYLSGLLKLTPEDTAIVNAAALLHDMARTEYRHAKAAAEIITQMGYPQVASAVGSHTDISVNETEPISIAEIIYLADKLTLGCALTNLAERFGEKLNKYNEPEVQSAIRRRLDSAMAICGKIEKHTGVDIDTLLQEYKKTQ